MQAALLTILLLFFAPRTEVLVFFTADNCYFCTQLKGDMSRPEYQQSIRERFGKYNTINLSRASREERDFAAHYKVTAVPVLLILSLKERDGDGKYPAVKGKILGYGQKEKGELLKFLKGGQP